MLSRTSSGRRMGFSGLTVIVLSALIGGCSDDDPDVGTLEEPPTVRSENGVLQTEFTAGHSDIEFDGRTVNTQVYDGRFVPPTLEVAPGDTIELTLRNDLSNDTNMHYHGMNVSPLPSAAGQGDDVFLTVLPGGEIFYSIDIPPDHPPGLYYYHPHFHGLTESQIGGGMSGGILIDGLLAPFPQLADIRSHLLLLKDLQIDSNGQVAVTPDTGRATQRTVNGQITPTIGMRPGEVQLWSVGNIGADIYYHLVLEGHTLYEIARDGQRHTRLVERQSILLPTSARSQFLVVGGNPGTYALKTLALGNRPPNYDRYFPGGSDPVYDGGACNDAGVDNRDGCENSDASTCMGPQGDCSPESLLATLVIGGPRAATVDLPTPNQFPPIEDLRGRENCPPRVINFEEDPTGTPFFINGQKYDDSVTNTTVRLGCIEEWTINNCTGENHVFHIHQLDFQVTEVNGEPQPFIGRQDTQNIPWRNCIWEDEENGVCQTVSPAGYPVYSDEARTACDDGQFPRGQVKVIIPFTNPVIAGKFVYHCHIGEHEDGGMMAVIEVCNDENVPCPVDAPVPIADG